MCTRVMGEPVMTPATELHREGFAQTLTLRALKVQAKQCQTLMKAFTG